MDKCPLHCGRPNLPIPIHVPGARAGVKVTSGQRKSPVHDTGEDSRPMVAWDPFGASKTQISNMPGDKSLRRKSLHVQKHAQGPVDQKGRAGNHFKPVHRGEEVR
eukprot:2691803-Alexandrium_andersonii.AAC.1